MILWQRLLTSSWCQQTLLRRQLPWLMQQEPNKLKSRSFLAVIMVAQEYMLRRRAERPTDSKSTVLWCHTVYAPSNLIDYKKQHTDSRLCFGFLLLDYCMRWKREMGSVWLGSTRWQYKAYRYTKYVYSTFLNSIQLNATLPPRITYDVIWNIKSGKAKNMPLDLHLEHLNNFLKSFLMNN